MTKSFYAASDETLAQIGKDRFEVEGLLGSDAGTDYRVRLAYVRGTREKAFTINSARPDRLGSVIGMFPVVILSPENNAITFGAPSDRRRFIDLVLSQLSRSYFDDLLEYRRVLRQRNRLLGDAKIQGSAVREDALVPWNTGIVDYGTRIIHRRWRFVNEFIPYVASAYRDMVETQERPEMLYETVAHGTSLEAPETIAVEIRDQLQSRSAEECRRGLSLVGPHRDELVFKINGINLQNYASQGQHKTFLVALKIAEFFYLKENKGETPILLLDDVLSELDDTRSSRLLEHVADLGQTIITTTDESVLSDQVYREGKNRRFYVEHGTCKPITADSGKVKEAPTTAWRSAE